MYKGKQVSVILATYKEKNSIKDVINEFLDTLIVDEVIVVDNNAEKGTEEEVKKTRARLVFEKKQGQGYSLRKGINLAKGEYIVLCEADGSYIPRDIEKFLAYAEDFPVVLGTRTNMSLVAKDSAMFFLRRLADILEGKLIEILFLSSTITDVGCTYKLLRRDILGSLSSVWITGDSHFVTEVTLQIAARRIPFVEIPISFRKRVGVSSTTQNLVNIIKWGYKLLVFIVYFWIMWRFMPSFSLKNKIHIL